MRRHPPSRQASQQRLPSLPSRQRRRRSRMAANHNKILWLQTRMPRRAHLTASNLARAVPDELAPLVHLQAANKATTHLLPLRFCIGASPSLERRRRITARCHGFSCPRPRHGAQGLALHLTASDAWPPTHAPTALPTSDGSTHSRKLRQQTPPSWTSDGVGPTSSRVSVLSGRGSIGRHQLACLIAMSICPKDDITHVVTWYPLVSMALCSIVCITACRAGFWVART
mmetsp:Transcript_7254/g.19758  ORF Transcript_7254/g.19758 Transcript_7254/m.19758 type:complete len:228 (-) Transcript_7254:331-1014(-)